MIELTCSEQQPIKTEGVLCLTGKKRLELLKGKAADTTEIGTLAINN